MTIKISSMAIAICALTACSNNGPRKDIIHNNNVHKDAPRIAVLNTQQLKEINVAMSDLGYNTGQIAMSAQQASINAASQPGAAPGAGAAGAAGGLIGAGIAQASMASAAQKQKNQLAEGLLSTLKNIDWQQTFSSSALSKAYSIQTLSAPQQSSESKIIITPSLQLSADYRSLILSVAITTQEQRKTVYKNYFHLQSAPLLEEDKILGDLNKIPPATILKILNDMLAALPKLIEQDMLSWPGKNLSDATSIRFKNSCGEYFERGYLLDLSNGKITFKTLRGEIKNYPASHAL
ncbi:MAG: hypothetical protein U1F46_15460 [Marinagarivorans sp.]